MPDHTSGSAIYTEDQRRRVIAFLDQHRGPDNPTSTTEVEYVCGIKERALRQLFSDLDGEIVEGWAFVLAYNEPHTRLWLATSREEALATTHRLRSQARNMNLRADRRERAYRLLAQPQGALI
jgi:hypothetical protein